MGGGARLEAPGQVVPLGVIDPDFLDHLAPAAAGLETVEHRPPAVQDADAGRAEHLVGGVALHSSYCYHRCL